MSHHLYNATPPGGYIPAADDFARVGVEVVKCVCQAVIPKDGARRNDDDTAWLCPECYEAVEAMKEGVIP